MEEHEFTHLSLSGGSGLSMRTLFECGKKFELKKLGYQPKLTPLPLVTGIIFHKYAEKRLRSEPFDVEEAKNALLSGKYHDERRDVVLEFDTTEMSTKKETKVEKEAAKIEQMLNKLKSVRNEALFGSVTALKPEDIERPLRCSALLEPLSGALTDRARRLRAEGIVFAGPKATLQEIAAANHVTPQRIYDVLRAGGGRDHGGAPAMPKIPPPGTGKKRLVDFCDEYGLDVQAILDFLSAGGVSAEPGQTLRAVAEGNHTTPDEIYERIRNRETQ